eukprot:3403385-Amphidinium_carterae.1
MRRYRYIIKTKFEQLTKPANSLIGRLQWYLGGDFSRKGAMDTISDRVHVVTSFLAHCTSGVHGVNNIELCQAAMTH